MRQPPFAAIELILSDLWADPPTQSQPEPEDN